MSNEKVSGFDMTPTLEWYSRNLAGVAKNLPTLVSSILGDCVPTPCFGSISTHDGSPVDPMDAASFVACAGLLPPQARARSNLRDIIIMPPQWFHRDSTGELPIPTSDVEQALSLGAIIPSFIRYKAWKDNEPHPESFGYYAMIEMYEMSGIGLAPELFDPMDMLRPTLRRIVWSQAFLHELAHSIVTPALFGGWGVRELRLPDGHVVDQHDFLMEAVPIVCDLPPISHYASTYRNKDGSLVMDRGNRTDTALNENLVEAMAARLLGFAYQPDGYGLNPFNGREPLREFVDDFLNAEWVA